jgi:threonine/homoserine/homoserine lactone efflux protein
VLPESPMIVDPLPFATYSFVMSITPGPNNVMLTASGAAFGFRRTIPHILGISFGCAVQLLAVCAGLGAVFTHWPESHDFGVLAAGAFMLAIMIVMNMPCIAVWALFGSSLRRFLERPASRMGFNAAMAVALAATGVIMVM